MYHSHHRCKSQSSDRLTCKSKRGWLPINHLHNECKINALSGEERLQLPVGLAKVLSRSLLSGVAGREREACTAVSIFTLSCVGELGADILVTSDCLSRTASSCRKSTGKKPPKDTFCRSSQDQLKTQNKEIPTDLWESRYFKSWKGKRGGAASD